MAEIPLNKGGAGVFPAPLSFQSGLLDSNQRPRAPQVLGLFQKKTELTYRFSVYYTSLIFTSQTYRCIIIALFEFTLVYIILYYSYHIFLFW